MDEVVSNFGAVLAAVGTVIVGAVTWWFKLRGQKRDDAVDSASARAERAHIESISSERDKANARLDALTASIAVERAEWLRERREFLVAIGDQHAAMGRLRGDLSATEALVRRLERERADMLGQMDPGDAAQWSAMVPLDSKG